MGDAVWRDVFEGCVYGGVRRVEVRERPGMVRRDEETRKEEKKDEEGDVGNDAIAVAKGSDLKGKSEEGEENRDVAAREDDADIDENVGEIYAGGEVKKSSQLRRRFSRNSRSTPAAGSAAGEEGIVVTCTFDMVAGRDIGVAIGIAGDRERGEIWPFDELMEGWKGEKVFDVYGDENVEYRECGEEEWTYKVCCCGGDGEERVLARTGTARE